MTPTRSALQISLLAVVAIGMLSGCGGAKARYASHLQRGQEYLASGNLEKAGVEFRNAAQIQPKSAAALYFIGRVAEARGNVAEAFGAYQAAIDADPAYDAARAGVGKMLVFAHGAKRALDVIAPGLAAHPDNVDLLAVRAAAHQQLKEKDAARADAERAVQLAASNENAVAVLAALYTEDKEFDRAIAVVGAALAKAPASVELHEVMTNLYLVSGQPQAAQQQMRKIIELQPLALTPRSQLAMHLARGGDLDGAQQVLEEAVRALETAKQPANAAAAKLLLVSFVSRERSREQGEKTLREFIAREPDELDLRLGLGELLQRAGALAEAAKAYQEVVTRDGTRSKGLFARDRLAAIQIAQGHAAEARQLLAEVLQKNPRDDDALSLRAGLEMQQHDPDGAIADLRAVLRNQPNSVVLQRSLAAAYIAKGQSGLAEDALRAGMKSAPIDAPVRIELAQLLARTERNSQAAALLEESVVQDPNNAELLNRLGGLYSQQKDFSRAADALRRAVEQQPQQWQLHRNLAQIELAAGDSPGALSEYAAALKLAPAEPQLVMDAARLYEQQGRIDAAIAGYEALYKENPKAQQWAANNLAMLLVTYKKDPVSLDRARELTLAFATSDNGALLDTVGWVRFKRGEYQQALQVLERATERAPDSRVIRFHLAMAQLQLGLRDRARTNLESALTGSETFEGSDEARTALAGLKARA
jgi:tetratricopeptide (TPR) repeat protein